MAILDIFTILFKSDTQDAKEGVQELDNKIDQLDSSVKDADRAFDKLDDSIDATRTATTELTTETDEHIQRLKEWAKTIALIAVGAFIKQSVDAADQLGEFTDSIDGNIETLSAWGDAVKLSGGDMASFQSTVSSLSADFTALAVKGKSKVKPFFDELGISMLDANGKARDVMEVLPEIAGAFEGMSKADSLAFGKKMGLDGGTVRLLQNGRKELESMLDKMKKLGVITREQADVSADFNDAIDLTLLAFRSVALDIAELVLPALTSVMNAIQEIVIFFQEHQGFAIGFFTTAAAIIIGAFLPAIVGATVAVGGFIVAMLAATWPFILLATVIGLAYDEFENWSKGAPSLLGDVLGDFNAFKDGVTDVFTEITDIAKAMWDALLSPVDTLGKVGEAIANAFELPDMGELMDKATMAFAQTASPMSGIGNSAVIGGATSNNSVTVGKVEVHTQATDADGISKAINGSMSRHLRQAMANSDDGVDR